MEKKRITFIINPKSGTSNKDAVVRLIPEMIDGDRFEWNIVYTEHAGHASQIAAAAAAEGCDIVVAVGGDGTVNEVARSLVHTNSVLGIIPTGSGNGLARHLQIPVEIDNALRVIDDCVVKQVDYCKINDIPFFCTCGVGFDACVSDKFAHAGKRGMLTYAETMLTEGLNYEADTYEIEVDGEKKNYRAFLIACANASQYGNNVYIAPEAHVTDGLMDVTVMEPFRLAEAPQVVYQLMNRTIDRRSDVHTYKCRSIKIRRQREGVIHYDGDPVLAPAELEVNIVPGGLKVIISSYERYSGGPLLGVLGDIYARIGSDLRKNNRRIQHTGKELLNKLKP